MERTLSLLLSALGNASLTSCHANRSLKVSSSWGFPSMKEVSAKQGPFSLGSLVLEDRGSRSPYPKGVDEAPGLKGCVLLGSRGGSLSMLPSLSYLYLLRSNFQKSSSSSSLLSAPLLSLPRSLASVSSVGIGSYPPDAIIHKCIHVCLKSQTLKTPYIPWLCRQVSFPCTQRKFSAP